MKKFRKILKRTAVGFLTVAMLVTSVDLSSLTVKAAGPDDKYAGEYTIESLLSQYEYFISGDADIYKHTVGSVAIGGELTQHDESIGNAAQYPFYIGKADEVYYSIEALDGIEPGEGAKTVYYLDGQVKSWNRGNTVCGTEKRNRCFPEFNHIVFLNFNQICRTKKAVFF